MKSFSRLLPCLFSLGVAHASEPPATTAEATAIHARAALTRDLGRNLVYHRVHRLPDDLPSVEAARKQPRVLDLRYVRADDAAAGALHAWIKAQATPRTPVFVLANSVTERDLIGPFTGRSATGSVLVIGAAARGFHPDIAVEISADDERRAYDAFESGAELATLLTENPHKVRNDEASLSRDRSTEPPPASAADDAGKNNAVPIDAALQRAVHLHRTLVALRKI